VHHANEPSRSYSRASVGLLAESIYAALVLAGACICCLVLRTGALRASLAKLTAQEDIFLIMGSALVVGCFFAAQNVNYRGIYFLFVLPGMLAVSRNANGWAVRAVGLSTSILIAFLMWGECIRLNLFFLFVNPATRSEGLLLARVGFWLLRDFAWWWVISILTAVLLEFVLASEVAQAALSFLLRRGESRSS